MDHLTPPCFGVNNPTPPPKKKKKTLCKKYHLTQPSFFLQDYEFSLNLSIPTFLNPLIFNTHPTNQPLDCHKKKLPGNSVWPFWDGEFTWPFWDGEFTWPFKWLLMTSNWGIKKVTESNEVESASDSEEYHQRILQRVHHQLPRKRCLS